MTNDYLFESFSEPERIWDIEGHPEYFFGADKKLYRVTKQGHLKENKLQIIGYTKGYILKSKFFSLVKLRPMLKKHAEVIIPF
jgi:hypothetical protein